LQGNTEEDNVQGNTKEDDAQDIDDKNNSPTALNAILPRMTRSTTRAAVATSRLGIVHHVFAAKAAKPNDAMDPEVRVNAINKEVRGLIAEHFLLCTSTQYLRTLISSVRVLSLA
jgi:ribosomal protein S12